MTYIEFTTRFPIFNDPTKRTQVESQLSFSALLLDSAVWGDNYDQGVYLDAAHNLALSNLANSSVMGAFQGTAGPVTNVSGGGLSTSFASPNWADKSAVDSWYNKTIYGQQFLRLRHISVPLGVMAI